MRFMNIQQSSIHSFTEQKEAYNQYSWYIGTFKQRLRSDTPGNYTSGTSHRQMLGRMIGKHIWLYC
ncbi:hypothetical protein BABINDRAFT_160849 [Babjeviella inositovora NRRL Y-12698]|uniref:Uncharacterized protein n=1 Tax=Babjeviella inositovora NRRL Y-12698 TaxID=984486 RepID=A0A1E3QSE7_9ASCO|nr:uncharacterized protein BABINDRAFT_160849 [Babjeviella inositovora NRRL Y-12698]ODQ80590.1 hypothetical protein BABINDRAFT_160849 [Babjeviella inositovora NRRL Y-12698]